MWSSCLDLRLCHFLCPLFQGRCWWNTFHYSWNWVNKSDYSSVWTCSSEWKWCPLSTAVENVFELSGKKRVSVLIFFFYHIWNFSWTQPQYCIKKKKKKKRNTACYHIYTICKVLYLTCNAPYWWEYYGKCISCGL